MKFHKVSKEIPRKTIYRLSQYQRCLQHRRDKEMETVSSEALAKAAGVKPTQLRKDLTHFGQLGTRGLGYNVDTLTSVLSNVLGAERLRPVILVGVGNLGAALTRYGGFEKEGFEIAAAFDADPEQANHRNVPFTIRSSSEMVEFIKENDIKMAILAVPARHAQVVANQLVKAGVQGILNFSPTLLETPDDVIVNSVDLAIELENLSYFIK
ncbi:MAG: redox-sensing transcriptional repressor Rex [Verrucomicrobiota bacterium]